MLELTAVAVVSIFFSPAAMADTNQAFPCEIIPVDADQACRECMLDACAEYHASIEACGGSSQCIAAARATYQVNLALCSTCNPAAARLLPALQALPKSRRVEFLTLWPSETGKGPSPEFAGGRMTEVLPK